MWRVLASFEAVIDDIHYELRKLYELPFLPFKGLVLETGAERNLIIDVVIWSNDEQIFYVRSNESLRSRTYPHEDKWDLERWKRFEKELIGHGWEVIEEV